MVAYFKPFIYFLNGNGCDGFEGGDFKWREEIKVIIDPTYISKDFFSNSSSWDRVIFAVSIVNCGTGVAETCVSDGIVVVGGCCLTDEGGNEEDAS